MNFLQKILGAHENIPEGVSEDFSNLYNRLLEEVTLFDIDATLSHDGIEIYQLTFEKLLLFFGTHLEFVIRYQFELYKELNLQLSDSWGSMILTNKKKIGAILIDSESPVESNRQLQYYQVIKELNLIAKFYKYNYEDNLADNEIEGLDCLLFRSVVDHIITLVDIILHRYKEINDLNPSTEPPQSILSKSPKQ